MNEIAIISDLNEIQNEDEEFLFLTLKKQVRVWYIKTKLPDGQIKWNRYATKPTSIRATLNSADMQLRNEIIQDRINELAREGFHVDQKYVSLFVSEKIKELIISRQHLKRKPQKNIKAKSDINEIDVAEESAVGRILKNYNQRNS